MYCYYYYVKPDCPRRRYRIRFPRADDMDGTSSYIDRKHARFGKYEYLHYIYMCIILCTCMREGRRFALPKEIHSIYICVYNIIHIIYVCVYTGTLSCCAAGIIKLLFRLPKIITAT